MRLVAVAQALHDAHRLLFIGLVDVDHLEAAGQGGILFHVLAILVHGGGANDLDFATGKGRLHDGGRVHGAFGGASADQGVDFIDEQQDVPCVLHFLDALLQAVLELTAVLAACHQGGNIQHDQALAAKDVRHLVGCHQLGQALCHGGLAHAGLADEQRVVLLTAGKDLHAALDFARTPNHRVKLAVTSTLGQVDAVLLQRAVRGGGAVEHVSAGVDGALPHQIVQSGAYRVRGYPQAGQGIDGGALPFPHDAQEQVLGGNVALAHLHGLAQGVFQHPLSAVAEAQVTGKVGGFVNGNDGPDGIHHRFVLHVQAVQGLGGKAVAFLDQAKEQVLRAHLGLMELARLLLGQDQDLAALVGKLIERH